MRTLAALLLCLGPALAGAQSAGVLSYTEASDTANGGKNDKVVNIAECKGVNASGTALSGDTLSSWSWTLTAIPLSGTWYKLYAMLASCPTGGGSIPGTGIVDLTSGFQATTGQSDSWALSYDARLDVVVPLAIDCNGAAKTTVNLCVTVFDSGQSTVQDARATAVLTVDLTTPAPPEDVAVVPGDSALNVTWTAGAGGTADATSFTATATGAGVSRSRSVTGGGSTSCRIDGLENGQTYDVTVVAYSDSDNPSAPSAAVPGTPEPVDDFWRHYKNAGGREAGGCGAGAAGGPALLALLALARRRRR